ncbi:MAG: RNA-binding protein [Selenomonadales bacterium]|nr:RNA-binding protein [Selenomonadales bacterium]
MSDREKILRYYKNSGQEDVVSKLLDLADVAAKTRKYRVSEFLDPAGFAAAETIIAQYDSLKLAEDGGYEGAERKKVAFIHRDFMGTESFDITAVRFSWDNRYHELSHRDVLGSIMGSGIKRDVIGDILMRRDHCIVVTSPVIANYLLTSVVTIGAAQVSASEMALDEIPPREQKVKEIRTTVASMRLDVIAAAGFGTSRSKMANEIDVDKVKVNWKDVKSSSQAIKEGDIISLRGRGRVEVAEVMGSTKKGRINLVLRRFI